MSMTKKAISLVFFYSFTINVVFLVKAIEPQSDTIRPYVHIHSMVNDVLYNDQLIVVLIQNGLSTLMMWMISMSMVDLDGHYHQHCC